MSGLAAIAGFCTTVYLVADFNFEPLTVVKKIILCGLAAASVAPMLDLALRNGHFIRYLIAAASGSAALGILANILPKRNARGGDIWYRHNQLDKDS